MVNRDIGGILKWTDGNGNGLDYIVKFIAKLLDPLLPESSSIFVGDLIVQLVRKANNHMLPVLPQLLTAIVHRLTSAKIPSFIQSLITVFAYYIHNDLDTVLSFLSSLQIGNQDGLTLVMNIWCDNQGSFHGFHAIKVSTAALAKLYMCQDPRLLSISVKGDLIATQPGSNILFFLLMIRNCNQVYGPLKSRYVQCNPVSG